MCAQWPANGVTDWNTKSLAYLAIEHNTDGTHAIKWPINGTGTRIYTKYFTGTLDSDSETVVAHGVTAANILHASAIVNDGTFYRFAEIYVANQAALAVDLKYDATNIILTGVGTSNQGNAYRIRIDYTV